MTSPGDPSGADSSPVSHPPSAGAASFTPYIPSRRIIPEFTPRAVLLGTLMSLLFGGINAYVGLKAGITVSASIPSAVLSMAILRGWLRRGTILENNVAHTIASSGESLAAGVIFTVPALIFIGVNPSGLWIFLVAATAGLLGILMMIPLRHYLTIAEHGALPYPEGTACAEVLIAGDRGRAAAMPVFIGIAIGGLYQLCVSGLKLWVGVATVTIQSLHKMTFGAEITPLYLSVGYLIGLRVSAIMAGGGILAFAVIIPVFDAMAGTGPGEIFGLHAGVREMSASRIRLDYVRYVGAGAVACGGLIAIGRILPLLLDSFRKAVRQIGRPGGAAQTPRTERDLPPVVVFGGTAALALAMWLVPQFEMGLLQTLLGVGFTYFFVVVSARMVGLVGSTSQPVSGMTITVLLATAFTLHAFGYEGKEGMAAGLTVAVLVCVAVALAGDISQDLKTGALLGATPRALQAGEIIGTLVAALRAGWLLYVLHAASQLGSDALPAPQARLMATIAEGVMQGQLPWSLMLLGAVLALAAELAGIASLPFAIGLYLPCTTTTPFLVGGLIAHWHARRRGGQNESPTLFASGLIAGEALLGILMALLVAWKWDVLLNLRSPADGAAAEMLLALAPYALVAFLLVRAGRDAAAGGRT